MKKFFSRQNIPRWMIFLIDTGFVVCSLVLAYLLRFNFSIPQVELDPLPKIMAYVVMIRVISFIIGKTYSGIIRYTSTSDAIRVIFTLFSGSTVFILTNIITWFINHRFYIPFSIIIIDFLITTMAMITFRMLVKMAYLEFLSPQKKEVNVIIYGAGEAGITTKRVLERDLNNKYRVIAFIDDNKRKVGKKLEGVDILGPEKIENLLASQKATSLILSIPDFDPLRKDFLVDQCLAHNVKVMSVPPMIRWINGELSFNQIRNINIEELLERPEIRLEKSVIADEHTGKVVMITAAA
ncbi:MAG: nucleoside-diphosphate sugar epimerase/dehydratase, partial [Syntrophothermus sp.]